jgi:cytochrome P450
MLKPPDRSGYLTMIRLRWSMPETRARVDDEISVHDSGFIADPYPDYARLRDSGPTYDAHHDLWLIASDSDVRAVLRDPGTDPVVTRAAVKRVAGPRSSAGCV